MADSAVVAWDLRCAATGGAAVLYLLCFRCPRCSVFLLLPSCLAGCQPALLSYHESAMRRHAPCLAPSVQHGERSRSARVCRMQAAAERGRVEHCAMSGSHRCPRRAACGSPSMHEVQRLVSGERRAAYCHWPGLSLSSCAEPQPKRAGAFERMHAVPVSSHGAMSSRQECSGTRLPLQAAAQAESDCSRQPIRGPRALSCGFCPAAHGDGCITAASHPVHHNSSCASFVRSHTPTVLVITSASPRVSVRTYASPRS